MTEEAISFSEMDRFPNEIGLYFAFLLGNVAYIGKADKQTIRKRCKQHVNQSSGGTFRKKIEATRKCSQKDAISYIQNEMTAKFITGIGENSIPAIEEIAIWAYQPILNAVKPTTFTYENLIIQQIQPAS